VIAGHDGHFVDTLSLKTNPSASDEIAKPLLSVG
jgi:hypothetical protein